ncbi:YbaK/aminoacyl-tRNA synthetase-associated domain isoform 1 [Gossypium australe]|uniref:YbaK/aminoacyl-tRNA synthetase-associated domain isoform 1 n=1 Tax=Gossypium australe TaxID=47621 RepID=A0A5B6UTE0_9ROSI|nr:YbaK/aminoacyl-tRNA synthetase-associated domain isoform 1 [Gossypium australe]
MEAALAELERVQLQILRRISKLELSHLPQNAEPIPSSSPLTNGDASSDVEACLSNILRSNGVNDFIFKRVASDYYDWPLESRRDVLGAASVHHLCKSIVLAALLAQVNTQAPSNVIDCSDRNNSKYYVVVVQYTARFNAETVKNFLYTLNNGKIPKKKFNLRLAPEETSIKLTGYEHNAVTCIGMHTDIPVILDEAIVKLDPGFFWLGGGEVDLKLGIRTSEFINFVKPFIVSCSGT